MVGLAAHRPTGVERRKDELLVQVAQDIRDSGREIVVEQDGAGVEAVEPEAGWRADQRFEQEGLAVGECYRRRGGDLREQRAEPDVEAGLAQDGGDLGDVLQVELVARVAFRDQEKIARIRTDLLDRHHRRVHAKRQEGRIQVVEAAGEEVGVDRRQLEAGVAQVARRIEGRGVLLPLAAQPVFDLRAAFQELAFEFEQGAGEGGCQVWNHGAVSKSRGFYCGCKSYTAVHKIGLRPHGQPVENR